MSNRVGRKVSPKNLNVCQTFDLEKVWKSFAIPSQHILDFKLKGGSLFLSSRIWLKYSELDLSIEIYDYSQPSCVALPAFSSIKSWKGRKKECWEVAFCKIAKLTCNTEWYKKTRKYKKILTFQLHFSIGFFMFFSPTTWRDWKFPDDLSVLWLMRQHRRLTTQNLDK